MSFNLYDSHFQTSFRKKKNIYIYIYSQRFSFLPDNLAIVVRLHDTSCQENKVHYMLIRLFSCPFSFVPKGFGFSDKPQPGYGFDYTLGGNCFICPNNGGYYSFVMTAEYVMSLPSVRFHLLSRCVCLS